MRESEVTRPIVEAEAARRKKEADHQIESRAKKLAASINDDGMAHMTKAFEAMGKSRHEEAIEELVEASKSFEFVENVGGCGGCHPAMCE